MLLILAVNFRTLTESEQSDNYAEQFPKPINETEREIELFFIRSFKISTILCTFLAGSF